MKSAREDDARRLSHEVLQVLRLRAVAALARGCSVAEVARVYGLNRRTVFRWKAAFAREGERGLLARPTPGRPARHPAA